MKPVVAYYLDSLVFGGAERVALSLLPHLSRAWRTVLLLHGDAPPELRRAAGDAGLALVDVPRVSGPGGIAQARAELRRLGPAVFHAQRPWPTGSEAWLLAARLAGVEAVLTTEHLFPPRLPRRGVLRERLLDPLLDMRIAVSQHVARRVRQAFGTPTRRLRVVANGIDWRPFQSASGGDALRRTLCDDGQHLVLTVAHLRPQKGLDTLVSAAALLPDVVFAVAGEGPDRDALQRSVEVSGLTHRVVLLGQRDDVPQLLAACDLFVLPSRDEGLPLAVLEAMAARRPVVATRVGGVPEAVVDGQHGRLIAPDDPNGLAAAIADLLARPGDARNLAERAHARLVERFTVERMAAETAAIYEGLLSQKGRGRTPQGERDRNRRLRRVDLRFAAGVPHPDRVAVESPDRLLAAGLEAVAHSVVPLAEAGVGTCDLIVLTGAAQQQLARAWHALRPGGACWVETRLWPHRRADDLTGRLERIGFTAVEPMAAWLSPSRTAAWAALNPRRAGTLLCPLPRLGGLNPVKRALRHMRSRAWRLRLAFRLGMPVSIVAQRPESNPGAPASNVRARIGERVALALRRAPGAAPPQLCWTFATGGRHSGNKVIGMIAAGPAGPVQAVVKFPRNAGSASALEREAHVLPLLSRERVTGVPCLIADTRVAGGVAVVESALAGRAFYDCLRRENERHLAQVGREWLVALGTRAQGSAAAQVCSVRDAFASIAGGSIEPRLLARGLAAFRPLERLPGVIEHRDFAPWNLLLDDGGALQVLDWESSVTDGVPGADLVYFLTYLGFSRLDARRAEAQAQRYGQLWDPRTSFGRTATAELSGYLAQLGLDPRFALPIRLYTWSLHATSEHGRRDAWPRAERPPSGLFLHLWRSDASLCDDERGPFSPLCRAAPGEVS